MNTQPILCSGNDLENVLADIRARKGEVASLEAMVGGHNADYRVNYFERGDTPSDGSSTKDKQQAPENHVGKVATVRWLLLQDEDGARNAMTRKASGVCAESSALNPSPPQVEVSEASIETRMSELQKKLTAAGKLGRIKTSTRKEHARLPHKND